MGQTNLYAVQEEPRKTLNMEKNEREQWLGYMSLTKLPDTRLHWSGMDENVACIMSRDRWETQYLC